MHKAPTAAAAILYRLAQEIPDCVVIAYIGRSNGAGPTLSAMSTVPVITVPASVKEFPDDVWSSLRAPSKVPVMTVLEPGNAVLAALQILAARNPRLYAHLRADIETRTFEEIARIDALGGALAAIERGYQQRAIEDSAYRYQREIEARTRVVVGVNAFQTQGDEAKVTTLRVDESVGARQRERLATLRRRRDDGRAERLRADLRAAAAGTDNLMPHLVAAVDGDVTLGEICTDLRAAFGTYVPADRG